MLSCFAIERSKSDKYLIDIIRDHRDIGRWTTDRGSAVDSRSQTSRTFLFCFLNDSSFYLFCHSKLRPKELSYIAYDDIIARREYEKKRRFTRTGTQGRCMRARCKGRSRPVCFTTAVTIPSPPRHRHRRRRRWLYPLFLYRYRFAGDFL